MKNRTTVSGNDPLPGHIRERKEPPARPHQRRQVAHQGNIAVRAHAHCSEVAGAAGFQQRALHLGRVRQAVDDEVQTLIAEVLPDPRRHAFDAEVALLPVALVVADVLGCVGETIERGVQWIDPLEFELPPAPELHRAVHLAAFQQLQEDPQGRRPASHADRRPGLGERLRDGEPEAAVIRDSGDKCALAGEIDREHVGPGARGAGILGGFTRPATPRAVSRRALPVWSRAPRQR